MRPTALIALILFPSLASCDSALGAVGETTNPSPWIATATGRIDSIDEARQLVASIDGVISHVLVRRGDRIAQGQILMRIDCAAREAAARAGAAEAASALLAARSVSSGTSADRAALIAEIDAATARLENEEAQLRRAEEILDRGFIARSSTTNGCRLALRRRPPCDPAALALPILKADGDLPKLQRLSPLQRLRAVMPKRPEPWRSNAPFAARSMVLCSRSCAARASIAVLPKARRC